MNYADFLASKAQLANGHGFEPVWMPDFLIDFQASATGWAIRKGRAGVYADCGLGKTPIALVCCENVIRHTNKPALLLTPLAVVPQMLREADKFGVEAVRSNDGKASASARVVVTNYDRLHHFSPDDFACVACDESGCIKDFDAQRTAEVTEFMRTIPYRFLFTATAAPNDYSELGTSAEALGEMGFADMATRFFKKTTAKDHRGWGRTHLVMRPHAKDDFWRWVCSWARAFRKPSDLGFDDGRFVLPELTTEEHVVIARTKRPGELFDLPAVTLEEQREERRRTLSERCDKVLSLVADTKQPAIVWCHLNAEGDRLEKTIPGAIQVSGVDSDEEKEEKIQAFVSGQARVMVSKPVLLGWGLNLQCCSHQTFFPSHSFEQYYQAVRRCWRFGQTRPVKIDMVTSEGERGVLANLQRKSESADVMFSRLVELMNDHLKIRRTDPFVMQAESPQWLTTSSATAAPSSSTNGRRRVANGAVAG